MTKPVNSACAPNPRVKLHPVHPPAFDSILPNRRLQAAQSCAAATRPNRPLQWGIIAPPFSDVQQLAGHRSLQTTQGYIDENPQAKRRVIEMI